MRPATNKREGLAQVLLACAKGDRAALEGALAGCPAPSLDLLPDAAEYHGLTLLVLRSLRGCSSIEPQVVERLQVRAAGHLAVALLAGEDLRFVADLLDGAGIAWAVLKGPVLAEIHYGDPSARSYGDLDLLVDPQGFGLVLDLLEAHGSTLIDTNWQLVRGSRRGELSLSLPGGTALDLHWSLVTEAAIRRRFRLATSEILARTRRRQLRAGEVPTLDASDMVLHVALHACLSGGGRLGWYLDVARVVQREDLDWAELASRAQSVGVGLPAAIVLGRARQLFDLELPEGALRSLGAGTSWARALSRVDAARPFPPQYLAPSSGQALLAATRATSASSAWSLAGSVRRDLARRVGGVVALPRGRATSPRNSRPSPPRNPLHRHGGTDEDRRAFLRALAAEDERALLRSSRRRGADLARPIDGASGTAP